MAATAEEVLLKSVAGVEDGSHAKHSLEQNNYSTDSAPETERTAAVAVITSQWKKVPITVTTLITYIFLYAGISMIAPFYPIEAQKHGVQTYITGFVVGMAPLCLALVSPFIGYFLPYFGMKFTQLAGLLWAGGSLILFGFVSKMPTPTLFIVFSFLLRTVEGVGTGMYSTVAYTMLTQLYPNNKGTVIGLLQLSISLGFLSGPAIGGGLQEAGGFVLPFLVVGGCTIVSLLLLMLLVQPSEECSRVKLPWQLLLKLFSNPVFEMLVLSLLMVNAAGSAVLTYFGQYLHTQFELSVGIIGIIYLAQSVGYSSGTIIAGQITDRLKMPRCLLIAGLVVALTGWAFTGPAKFITTPKLWISIPAVVVAGGGWALTNVPVYSDMNEVAKMLNAKESLIASTLSGVLVGGISGGESLGSVMGGFLVYKVSFPWMATIFSLILLVCAMMLGIATVVQRVWSCYRNKKLQSQLPLNQELGQHTR